MNVTEFIEDEAFLASYAQEDASRRTIKFIFCTFYFLIFVFGTFGNGCVIMMLINVFTQMRSSKTGAVTISPGTTHVFIYVLGLSIVDFLVIIHLPLLIFDIAEGQWIFGLVMCKLYWIGESVNKLLSAFLMTVLSWDRYLAVCAPIVSYRFRTNMVSIIVLFFCTILATILLYPVLSESSVQKIDKTTGLKLSDEEFQLYDGSMQNIVYKCVFETNSATFMIYTFLFGYLVPAILISLFYWKVIRCLREKAKTVRSDLITGAVSQRLQRVTKRIITVVLFYFFCWTPYWLLNIMLQFQVVVTQWSNVTISTVFFSAHMLVCFNSAANPVLYALINRELRQQHTQALMKRRRSHGNPIIKGSNEKLMTIKAPTDYISSDRRHTTIYDRNESNASFDSKIIASLVAARNKCRCSLPHSNFDVSFSALKCGFKTNKSASSDNFHPVYPINLTVTPSSPTSLHKQEAGNSNECQENNEETKIKSKNDDSYL